MSVKSNWPLAITDMWYMGVLMRPSSTGLPMSEAHLGYDGECMWGCAVTTASYEQRKTGI